MTLVILALIACGPKAPDEATASADADADADGDGAIAIADGGTDCDDADANVWPGAPEVCDGVQNDCSTAWASTDEDGLVTLFDTAETVSADLTATFASGTPSALTTYDLPAEGTLRICAGTYHVALTATESEAEVVGVYGASMTALASDYAEWTMLTVVGGR